MAQARARARAAEWVAANQLKLTIGGPEGGGPTSLSALIGKEGFSGLGNIFKTEWQIAKAIVGPITPLYDGSVLDIFSDNPCVIYQVDNQGWRACSDEEQQQLSAGKCDRCRNRFADRTPGTIAEDLQARLNEQSTKLGEAQTAIEFNLDFNTLSDSNTYELERQLNQINGIIKSSSESFGAKAGKGLVALCNQVRSILLNHCKNKAGDVPGCK